MLFGRPVLRIFISVRSVIRSMKVAVSMSGVLNVKKATLMAGNGVPLHVAVQHNTMVFIRNKHGVNPYRDDNGHVSKESS